MFTEEELKLVIALCDLALKTNGLASVNTVVPLAGKCQNILEENIKKNTLESKVE